MKRTYIASILLTSDLRWQPTPQTRRMPNPQGPKTERGNVAVHENEIVKAHLLAKAVVLVNEIAQSLQIENDAKTRTETRSVTEIRTEREAVRTETAIDVIKIAAKGPEVFLLSRKTPN